MARPQETGTLSISKTSRPSGSVPGSRLRHVWFQTPERNTRDLVKMSSANIKHGSQKVSLMGSLNHPPNDGHTKRLGYLC